MKRPTPKIKVFIDTNVLIAGLASLTGASAAILDLCEAEVIQMVVSRQVLVEADRNITAKLPGMVSRFRQFIQRLAPLMVEDPRADEMKKAANLVDQKDAPILAAAQAAGVDFLVTLDKRHFLASGWGSKFGIKVVSPLEFLKFFEGLYLEK